MQSWGAASVLGSDYLCWGGSDSSSFLRPQPQCVYRFPGSSAGSWAAQKINDFWRGRGREKLVLDLKLYINSSSPSHTRTCALPGKAARMCVWKSRAAQVDLGMWRTTLSRAVEHICMGSLFHRACWNTFMCEVQRSICEVCSWWHRLILKGKVIFMEKRKADKRQEKKKSKVSSLEGKWWVFPDEHSCLNVLSHAASVPHNTLP